jgi:hypothetical protein
MLHLITKLRTGVKVLLSSFWEKCHQFWQVRNYSSSKYTENELSLPWTEQITCELSDIQCPHNKKVVKTLDKYSSS